MMGALVWLAPLLTAGVSVRLGADAHGEARGGPPGTEYLVFAVSESADQVALLRFDGHTLRVDHTHKTGSMPSRLNGPHGIAVSPDGRYYYVSVAHGTPWGSLWKYTTVGDTLLGTVDLGMFPATVQVTPDGLFAFVVNFNLYGDMVPSSVSVVSTADMLEVARTPTCVMPHGSRINPRGTRQYSVCMMSDLLVELDVATFGVIKRFALSAAADTTVPETRALPTMALPTMAHGEMPGTPGTQGTVEMPPPTAHHVICSPTWAQPGVDGRRVYVACNKSSEILEVDLPSWTINRRFPAGDGVYNLAVTPDGRRLLATNKRGRSLSVFDLATGAEAARIPTTRGVVHGVVASPDGRYAFVTEEGVGGEPGTVEVFDLTTLRSVAAVDVGQQAAGIDFWKVTTPN